MTKDIYDVILRRIERGKVMKEKDRKLLEEIERTGKIPRDVLVRMKHPDMCWWASEILDEELKRAIQRKILEKAEKNRRIDDYDEWELGVCGQEIENAVRQCLTYQVVGMRSEKYLGKGYYQHNDVIELRTEEMTRDILCCTNGGRKFEIAIWKEWREGMWRCGIHGM